MENLFELSKDGKSITKIFDDRTIVIIPDGIVELDLSIFYHCKSLQTLVIPKSIEKITLLFSDCEKLEDIIIDEDNSFFKSINGVLFNKDCTKLVRFPKGKKVYEYAIPQTVEVIGAHAFHDCVYLKSLEANSNSLKVIGDWAFCGCKNLLDVQLPSDMDYIGEWAFGNCFELRNINIPKGLKKISNYVFSGSKIESAIIPIGVTKICDNAFSGCKNLVSVEIPNTVESIGVASFGGCGFSHLTIPNSVKEIFHWAFHRSALQEVEIPNSVAKIGNNAFDQCVSLESCKLPISINYLAEGTFKDCTSLTSIDLPSSVIYIGEHAFENCTALKDIDLSNNILKIDYYAFGGCTNLLRINLPQNLKQLNNYAFMNCSSLEAIVSHNMSNHFISIDGVLFNKQKTILIKYPEAKKGRTYTIPNGVEHIGIYALSKCSNLEEVILSDTVIEIGDMAFLGSKNLSKIHMSENLKIIGESLFDGCISLKEITIPSNVKEIKDFVFIQDLKSLKAIHSKITNLNDVIISSACFYESEFDNVTLYVPSGTRWDYKNHPYWGQYKHIEIEDN